MAKTLVIVESPAKARTISGFLGADYVVESSIGHVRDLPASADEVPKAYKSYSWARLGIDVDNDFKPLYVVNKDKRGQIRKLKSLLAESDELYLATDEDREGEAIAWHLVEVLNPRVPVKRMVFHEITRPAIQAAVRSPRDLDRRLVDAQEARRMLDRLYGYEVSPVLWKKVMPRLSAGRVQSVAIRMVVERERQRMAFVKASYWSLTGTFAATGNRTPDARRSFKAKLVSLDGTRLATGRDFNAKGQPARPDVVVLDAAGAKALVDDLNDAVFTVKARQAKPYRRRPAAPFTTSTFQQAAVSRLRVSSASAMRAAQSLYEKGYITYMRTDSTSLSSAAVSAARAAVKQSYGPSLVSPKPRVYATKAKNAQEAHEAIRPAGDTFLTPKEVAGKVPLSESRVYELIWQRTLASQMTDCIGETVQLRIGAVTASGRNTEFTASGTVITHKGFREVYSSSTSSSTSRADAAGNRQRRLPMLNAGDVVQKLGLEAEGHDTQPPARYTEASLVKQLEQIGVGRPSTYVSILQTIVNRGYVWKKGSALVPSFTAFSVVNLLEDHFPKMVDYAFTAEMEGDLDKIAGGDAETVPWLTRFYFGGDDDPGLKEKVSSRLGDIDAREVNTIPLGVDESGVGVVIRVGRFGPYVQRGDDRASVPDDIPPDELTVEGALKLLTTPRDRRLLGNDPETGLEVVARLGRFGPYVQFRPPDEASQSAKSKSTKPTKPKSAKSAQSTKSAKSAKSAKASKSAKSAKSTKSAKPKSASLFKTMSFDTVTLEEALPLLSLPRTVGVDPADGIEITAHNGRYMPYIKKGKESRNLAGEEQIFSVTLEECLALLAQPKQYRRAAPRPPLKELGEDPETGKTVLIRDGRFGPYVTDGDVNASLRKGDTVEELSIERASELLADRRARGPVKKKTTRKKTTRRKPAAKKTATAKKATTAKKTTARKPAAKKSTTRKPAAKKSTTAKKTAARKPAAKKSATAKKTAARKPAAKKTTTAKKTAAAKKTATSEKTTTVKKTAARKPAVKKTAAATKTAARKPAAKSGAAAKKPAATRGRANNPSKKN